MGQKAHPTGSRLGYIKGWDSNWYGGDNYVDKIVEDERIRQYLITRLKKASVLGRVSRPGVYEFRGQITVLELLSRAGGPTPDHGGRDAARAAGYHSAVVAGTRRPDICG